MVPTDDGELCLAETAGRLHTRFLGRWLIYRSLVGSTQDLAQAAAVAGAPEGTVVLANGQAAGRGRLGRSWVSPPGRNLYLSAVLRPPVVYLRALGVISPLAVARAVEETTGLTPTIKWPNDILLGGLKLAGILIDSQVEGDKPSYAVVGIGLNVNLEARAYPEIATLATSLRQALGREVPREVVLAALLNWLEELYLALQRGEAVHEEWRRRLETLGRQVRVRFGAEVEEGLAEDVDSDASLILRRPDGSRVVIAAGEVTLRD